MKTEWSLWNNKCQNICLHCRDVRSGYDQLLIFIFGVLCLNTAYINIFYKTLYAIYEIKTNLIEWITYRYYTLIVNFKSLYVMCFCNIAKVEVAGSNPVSRSNKYTGQVKYLALILWGFTAFLRYLPPSRKNNSTLI